MILPTPRSTLFPYTTLFRSHPRFIFRGRNHFRVGCLHEEQKRIPLRTPLFYVRRERNEHEIVAGLSESAANGLRYSDDLITVRDRKSTRLNSSHPSISYAVF